MKKEVLHIENRDLPDVVAEKWYQYPCSKVLDQHNNYVFGFSSILHNNIIYVVHDLGNNADLSGFVAYAGCEHYDYET